MHKQTGRNCAPKTRLAKVLRDLVIANRILAHEQVLDAYGHVSARHPDNPTRFFLSRSRSPELVALDDIMEFGFDGAAIEGDGRAPYYERFIHAAIYEARPDVNAIVHSHAEEVIPFSVTGCSLRPIIHSAATIGKYVPVWDPDEPFGTSSNLMVQNIEEGRDLAARLGANNVVLMRGHGFSAAAASLLEAVIMGYYVARNARMQMDALRLGTVKYLHDGEIDTLSRQRPESAGIQRVWEYWSQRAGFSYELGGFVPEELPVGHSK